MFGSDERLEAKLRESGRTASATVLKAVWGAKSSSGWTAEQRQASGRTHCKLQLRVEPEGEQPFEAKTSAKFVLPPAEGTKVEVLYDSSDHSKIVVPVSSDGRPTMSGLPFRPAGTAEEIAERLRNQQAKLQPSPDSRTADPVERLKDLADLRDRGALTNEAFEQQKAKLLSES